MTPSAWITIPVFAALAKISRRAAELAAQRAAHGKHWREAVLIIRMVEGRGGRSGELYEIAVNSLPAALQIKHQLSQQATAQATQPAFTTSSTNDDPLWQRRLTMLQPAIDAEAEHKPVLPALREAAARRGRSVETLRIWWKRYKKDGIAGLQWKARTNSGHRAVLISKRWDAATATLSDEKRQQIVADMEKHVRSLYAAGAPGRRHVAQLATPELVKLTRAAGVELSDREALHVCRVPELFARRGRHHRIVAIKRDDAKRFFDRHVPRIKRDRNNLGPMEKVAGDGHHIDIYYKRADGSLATAKMIIWLDLATNRIFVTIVFLEKGKGITQEHVIGSFIEMTQAWGVPCGLYLDNGSEYQWTEIVEDLLKCASFTGHNITVEGKATTNARPYNAQGKVVESYISVLERIFPMLPGYIGGDRMTSKTANVGKEPLFFPGSTDELREAINHAVTYYEVSPATSGHRKGKSPREAYNEFIDAGWKRTVIDRHVLEAVFADNAMPKVDRGHIRIKGIDYYADRLLDFSGRKVRVRVPKVGDRSKLLVLDDEGHVACYAERDDGFAFGDLSGAREQGRRNHVLNASVKALRAETVPLALREEMQRVVALAPPERIAPVDGQITMSDSLEEQGAVIRKFPIAPKRSTSRNIEDRRRLLKQINARRKAGDVEQ